MPNTTENNNNKRCKTFTVKRHENISVVAATKNLPVGPCTIELYYGNRLDVRLYINGKIRNIRATGRRVSQYFNAPDTRHGDAPKWKMVFNEMNKPGHLIEEITVRVCALV